MSSIVEFYINFLLIMILFQCHLFFYRLQLKLCFIGITIGCNYRISIWLFWNRLHPKFMNLWRLRILLIHSDFSLSLSLISDIFAYSIVSTWSFEFLNVTDFFLFILWLIFIKVELFSLMVPSVSEFESSSNSSIKLLFLKSERF